MNPASFVVLGDGLAAGAGDFGLNEELQPFSFPAQIAARIGSLLPQPIVESPGIGPVIGFPELPVRVPQAMQTTVLKEFPPTTPYGNLSIPGLRLADALTRRPMTPLVHRGDALQTAVNLILGLPSLAMPGSAPPPTQLEYALHREPTFVLVALGYFDVLDAVFKGDPAWIPDDVTFRVTYRSLLQPFGAAATVIVSTIPDPADTAYFTRAVNAPRLLKAEAPALATLFGIDQSDAFTPAGLVEAGCRLLARQPGPLAHGCVVRGTVIARISERVAALNAQIRSLAGEMNAVVFDLHGVFQRVKRESVAAGERLLTADYLGGFYSLNGVYPGATGHGVIANALLHLLNKQFGTAYTAVDLTALAASDPVVDYRVAEGPSLTLESSSVREFERSSHRDYEPSSARTVDRSKSRALEPSSRTLEPSNARALELPPNRQQVLPLDASSFYGDALRATHTRDERDAQFGGTSNVLFGGVCLFHSHLRGSIRITFSEPDGDVTHFEVTHEGGLSGDDGRLVAPQWFQLPCLMNQVRDVPGSVSSGDLNLATGEVTNLTYTAAFLNTGLMALAAVNPKLPQQPVTFPGPYGSAWAKFEQREDGLLDFSFRGVTFVPLGGAIGGDPVRFPLPFATTVPHGLTPGFASIPGAGSALHPHIYLTTKAEDAPARGAGVPDIPENTIRELTTFTHNTAFGDTFTLNIDEHGGAGTGRSHLQGRVQVQFGAPSGGSVPVLISTLVPGGLLARSPDSPLASLFPGRLSPGLIGHDEVLHFPNIAYPVNNMTFVDDPFEFAIGSVEVATGRLIGPLLYRGFIVHDMILALMQLEPRTPKSSWFFRGPARFERDAAGQMVFAFAGKDRVPYPEGFAFPQPDLRSAFIVGPRSTLDPFLYMQAMDGHAPSPAGKSGAEHHVVASNGQRFSYSFAIPGIPAGKPASFTYVNETTGGAFKMTSLLWVSFANAKRERAGAAESDVVTFSGLGMWNEDTPNPHIVTAQFSTAPGANYVSIQIDGGLLSNVNTKPESPVLPIPEYPLF